MHSASLARCVCVCVVDEMCNSQPQAGGSNRDEFSGPLQSGPAETGLALSRLFSPLRAAPPRDR